MDKELFITDLDHTFLHSSQTITPYSKDVWNRKSKEFLLSIATARSFSKTEEFFKGLNLNAPLILLDGAMVTTIDKKIIKIRTLKKIVTGAILNESKKFNILPFIISLADYKSLKEYFLIPPFMNEYQSNLINSSYAKDTRVKPYRSLDGVEDTLKLVYMGSKSQLEPLSLHLKELFQDEIELKLSPEKYMNCYFLTILHPLGDKAHALREVSNYLDIPLKSVTVFGDSLNDIGMFKIAGRSVAVSNALESVKQEASIILKYSNDEDGVAKFLSNC